MLGERQTIMSVSPGTNREEESEEAHCLTRSVVDALAEDPTLEAVTIDRARKTISVATLGKADVPKLTERISQTFQRAQATKADHGCTLLAGHGECRTCVNPLTELQ